MLVTSVGGCCREPGYSGGMYHMGASTSQASSSHQSASAGSQFLYPPQFPGLGANGPNVRMPAPPIPKHMVRPEAIFPPPKRGAAHQSATVTSRQIKQEPRSPVQQPVKTHAMSHHLPRNGTHMSENPAQQPIKHENMQMKYPQPIDKRSASHQKSHSKSYNSSRTSLTNPNIANWGSSNEIPGGRGLTNDSKYIKTEPKSDPFQQLSGHHVKMMHQKPVPHTTVKKPLSPAFSSPVNQSRSPFSSPKKQPFSPPPFSHQIKQQRSPLYSPPSKKPFNQFAPIVKQPRSPPPFSPPKKRPFTPPFSPPRIKPYTPPFSPPKKQPRSPSPFSPPKKQALSPPFSPPKKQLMSPPFSPPRKKLISPPFSPLAKHPLSPVFSPLPMQTAKTSQALPITHVTPNKPSTKLSSIFSPDKVTPPPCQSPPRDIKPAISPLLLSPLTPRKSGRSRTQSSGSSSEPELIPVMPKLEDISGFESIAKGTTAIKLTGKPSGPSSQSKEKKKGTTVPTVAKEIKPVIVSPPQIPDVVDSKPVVESLPTESSDALGSSKREHKKKKKHKEHREHKEHKDKDKEKKKDKHKEKHRDKEKDKEKDKHRGDPAPIRITIPKDKIHKMNLIQDKIAYPTIQPEYNASLKIKIPKDKLKVHQVEQPKPSGLKIKISKEALTMSSSHSLSSSKSGSFSGGTSKKRERSSHKEDRHSHSSKPSKMAKTNGDHRSVEVMFY